jgi:hypothetical protein
VGRYGEIQDRLRRAEGDSDRGCGPGGCVATHPQDGQARHADTQATATEGRARSQRGEARRDERRNNRGDQGGGDHHGDHPRREQTGEIRPDHRGDQSLGHKRGTTPLHCDHSVQLQTNPITQAHLTMLVVLSRRSRYTKRRRKW